MLRKIILCVFLGACALVTPAFAQESPNLAKLAGHWSCKGYFTANHAAIAGELSIQMDEASGALIVRHDDVAPGAYHALEVWMANKSRTGFKAAISDKFSGMRWFESTGWEGATLTWTRLDRGIAAEQFVYKIDGDTLQVSWSIAQAGAMKLGDMLTCQKF